MTLFDMIRRRIGRSPQSEPSLFRLVERGTGRVIATTADRETAFGLLNVEVGRGRGWDDLDLLDESGESLMVRQHERAVDLTLPRSSRPTYYVTLVEARSIENSYVVADGDWGGQVYFTIPAAEVACSEERVRQLVREVDQVCWGGQEEGSLGVNFRSGTPGEGVVGGMGGGVLRGGLWVHDEISQLGWKPAIGRVLAGKVDALDPPVPGRGGRPEAELPGSQTPSD